MQLSTQPKNAPASFASASGLHTSRYETPAFSTSWYVSKPQSALNPAPAPTKTESAPSNNAAASSRSPPRSLIIDQPPKSNINQTPILEDHVQEQQNVFGEALSLEI